MDRSEPEVRAEETSVGGAIDTEQFAELFRDAARVLWLIAAGIVRDASCADDVLQDAAIVALGKLDQYASGTNFTAWMSSIVRFVALNQARKQRRHQHGELDPNTAGLDSGQSSEPQVRDRPGAHSGAPRTPGQLFDDEVQDALAEINDTARACLLLRTVEGMGYARIATLLDIPEGTAMSHVHRSRRFLRERLHGKYAGLDDTEGAG